ncbi:hypothetical protein CLOM_g18758 [Closterium sp. NIES-68]|nr:hypothetical protein CLOM_g18758 [Closterium sp. NIES-68]
MENLPYKEWKAENQAKIGVRLGEVKSTGLEHVELPLELSSSSTITRQSPQMNGDEEEEEMPGEPTNPKEAWEGPHGKEWKKASDEEMGSIIENDTFDLVNLPPGRKAISSKWLFKRKTDADGNIERYKSRLGTTLRTLFVAAAIKGWVVQQMDIVTAFLNGVLEEETYMEQPEGYNDGSGREVMLKLQDKFKCKTLGDVNYYLGLHIERDVEKRWMRVHQKKYLETLAASFGKSEGHVATPLPSGFKCVKGPAEESVEPEDMTSVGGFICCVGGGPTAWESKKQVDQALSSVESEYMALFRAIREVVWQRRLLAELWEEQQGPTPLYCDSQGAIALAKNPVLHGLTKHMKVKWHWVRSMVTAGEVELHYVKTTA